jgi:hypothetical protein
MPDGTVYAGLSPDALSKFYLEQIGFEVAEDNLLGEYR